MVSGSHPGDGVAISAVSQPVTPQPPHATIPSITDTTQISSRSGTKVNMTPPPSSQVPSPNHMSVRTPTPTTSHISTPPPTINASSQSQTQEKRASANLMGFMSPGEISGAPAEELRSRVGELQSALQEAKMSAAHHKLQYQMLAKESAAAIERMAVEARMTQYENDVIHIAEQAKASATPNQPLPLQDGMIPVQKDLYQSMCREIQHLSEVNAHLHNEHVQQERVVAKQESEIASLSDKVILMRERIRENREHMSKMRLASVAPRIDSTPRSVYSTPSRHHARQDQTQPFAALLQASEMASQEAHRPVAGVKRGHSRNSLSLSSLPATPARYVPNSQPQSVYQTPQGRQPPVKVPATAPLPRTSLKRTSDVYTQPILPVAHPRAPASDEGTVSASEHNEDSEAETDIIEPEEGDEVRESQASRAASQMLRASQDQQVKRDSFKGNGLLGQQVTAGDPKVMKQTKLFGAVRKANADRHTDEPLAKRARVEEPRVVGLGIAGVKE